MNVLFRHATKKAPRTVRTLFTKTVKKTVLAAAAVTAMMATSGIAAADPTPAPSPGYQIAGPDGPEFPGLQVYPPVCGRYPLASGFHFDPGTWTWQPPKGDQ